MSVLCPDTRLMIFLIIHINHLVNFYPETQGELTYQEYGMQIEGRDFGRVRCGLHAVMRVQSCCPELELRGSIRFGRFRR